MKALQDALTRQPELVEVLASDVVAKTAFAVAQRASSLVPVRSGALKAGIASSSSKTNGRVGLSDPQRLYYWRFVEFGTVNKPARPFFRPAAEAEQETFVERIRGIGAALERDFSAGRNL